MNGNFRPLNRVSRRQSQDESRSHGIQTRHFPTIQAVEMGMLMVLIEHGAESPGAIFGSDFMRQALRNQPFQDTIQGHPVKMLTLCDDSGLDIVMAEGAG